MTLMPWDIQSNHLDLISGHCFSYPWPGLQCFVIYVNVAVYRRDICA